MLLFGLIILMELIEEVWFVYVTGKIVCNSFISVISDITLHNAYDIAMYSASGLAQ